MIKRGCIVLALLILIAADASAQRAKRRAPEIGITTDRDVIVQSEPFVLTIKIETYSQTDPKVRLPNFGGFKILQQSESHPMSFSFSWGMGRNSNRQVSRQSIYTFVLVTDQPKKHVIAPVRVVVDEHEYKGDPYPINVRPSGKGGGAGPQQVAPTPTEPTGPDQPPPDDSATQGLPGETLDGARFDKDYFIQTALSKKKAVVGESLILTVYLYTAWRTGAEVLREPGTEGFWVENLLSNRRRPQGQAFVINNQQFERIPLRKYALYPIKPGTLTIAPAIVELEVRRGGFFSQRKTVKRVAVPVQVEVAPLPKENQPTGFDPANVGKYAFKTSVDHTKVKAGEPVTLTLSVRGEGNLRNLVLPEVTDVEGFKVYAPESEVDVRVVDEAITGSRTSRILMIPKAPGEFVVPAISWSYFDPAAGRYQTKQGRAHRVVVTQGDAAPGGTVVSASPTAEPIGDQSRLNRQLRSILSRSPLKLGDAHAMIGRPWFYALVVLVALAYLGTIAASQTRRRLIENRVKGRSKRAMVVAKRRLDQLKKNAATLSKEPFFGELQRIFIGFLEDRLETPVAGDTMTELHDRLLARGIDAARASAVITELESCEFARFAKSTGQDDDWRRALTRVERLIGELARIGVTAAPKGRS